MNEDIARLCKSDAAKLIRDCLRQGRVRTTRHFRDELENEGLTVGDAYHVLQHGIVSEEPEHDAGFQQWHYRMSGTEPDGKYITLVFTFEGNLDGVLITVFSLGSWQSSGEGREAKS